MNPRKIYRLNTAVWNVERIIFLMAGIFVLGGVWLSLYVNPKFVFFILLVGAMLINFALTGYCPLAILLGYLKKD